MPKYGARSSTCSTVTPLQARRLRLRRADSLRAPALRPRRRNKRDLRLTSRQFRSLLRAAVRNAHDVDAAVCIGGDVRGNRTPPREAALGRSRRAEDDEIDVIGSREIEE